MGDSRFSLKGEFRIYGEVFPFDWWLNWYDNGDGIDRRIVEFFRDCHDKAYRKYLDETEAGHRIRQKQEEDEELAEYERLKAKYESTP